MPEIHFEGKLLTPEQDAYQQDKLKMFQFIQCTNEFREMFMSGQITPEWILEHWRIRMTKVNREGTKDLGSIDFDVRIL